MATAEAMIGRTAAERLLPPALGEGDDTIDQLNRRFYEIAAETDERFDEILISQDAAFAAARKLLDATLEPPPRRSWWRRTWAALRVTVGRAATVLWGVA